VTFNLSTPRVESVVLGLAVVNSPIRKQSYIVNVERGVPGGFTAGMSFPTARQRLPIGLLPAESLEDFKETPACKTIATSAGPSGVAKNTYSTRFHRGHDSNKIRPAGVSPLCEEPAAHPPLANTGSPNSADAGCTFFTGQSEPSPNP
jgi:hypothetical protein